MMFLIFFALTTVLGVRADDEDCTPECSKTLDFTMNLIKLEMALERIGNGLPSNEFFKENCDFLVDYLKCYQKGCGLRHVVVNLDAVVNVAEEFCNEESALRKAYVDNVDCYSGIEFTEDTCLSSILRATDNQIFNYELRESLEKRTVDRFCLFFYFFTTCVVDIATATCGKQAGRAAGYIMNRVMDVALCNPNEMDFFQSIFDFSEAAQSSRGCNSTMTPVCSGQEEIMTIIEEQKVFPSEEDLQKYCSQFKEALECPAERAKQCHGPTNDDSTAAYEELLQVLNEICDESSAFRASYLKSVSCYNNILEGFADCSFEIKDDVNRFMHSDTEAYSPLPFGRNAPLKYICMTTDLVPNCQIREAAENCGADAARTLAKLLLSLQKMSLSMNCRKPHMAIWRDEFFMYLVNDEEEGC